MNSLLKSPSTESTTANEPLPIQIRNLVLLPGVIAVDFETFYSTEYSVSDMGPWHYCHDTRFDPYLVSIVGRLHDGTMVEYVGHPADFAWDTIKDCTWLSHNMGFDSNVYRAIREKSPNAYPIEPRNWHCTANLSVYVGGQRSLGAASEHLLGVRISKDLRNHAMKGKRWHEFDPEMKEKVKRYALMDSYLCAGLWSKYGEQWPENERYLSRHTYDMGDHGICLDVPKAEEGLRALSLAMHTAELQIPWRHDHPLLSPKQFGIACRAMGITPPQSLAMSNDDTDLWFDTHGDEAPFAGAMRTWRRANALREKLKTMISRVMPNGRMCYSLLYMGGHTGRWSGSGGFNAQNLPRNSQFIMDDGRILLDGKEHEAIAKLIKNGQPVPGLKMEFNFRNLLIAAPGHKLVICDLAQIEARILPWLGGDADTLTMLEAGRNEYNMVEGKWKMVSEGPSIYEVHARRYMGWTGGVLKRENPALYLLAKARVLALGFQAGHIKFIDMASIYITDPAAMDLIFGKAVSDTDVAKYVDSQTWQWVKEDTADPVKRAAWLETWGALDRKTRTYRVNSWLQVKDFREGNTKTVGIWKSVQAIITAATAKKEDFTLGLPSGRELHYFEPARSPQGGVVVRFQKGGHPSFVYGGLGTENVDQAIGRDVLGCAIERTEKAIAPELPLGRAVILHVHDELVAEVPLLFESIRVFDLMRIRPEWAKTLPIDAEMIESPCYVK